ncbi:MAG: Hsp33 family molecular chaperone HslO [Deltaproteobacteria bacterium]|nr:Hsp33 family molecular chaperone HslO [Deltaproteobacteria bacterium]
MQELANLALFKRYLWEEASLLVVTGDMAPAVEGRVVYNARFDIKEGGSVDPAFFTRILTATGLAAVSLSERESWGWTFTLPGSSHGFFVGVEPEGMICARIHETDTNRHVAVLQRQRPEEPLKESHFEVPDEDPAHLVERYFEGVDQIATRVAVDDSGLGVLVQAMPGGRFREVTDLQAPELIERIHQLADRDEMKPLQEVLLFYECRCHDEMIIGMLSGLPEERQQELWGDLEELEVECPRCGRKYVVKKKGGAAK